MVKIFLLMVIIFPGGNSPVEASTEVLVHYNRIENDYDSWSLWVWNADDNKEGFEIKPFHQDDFGLVFSLELEKHELSGKNIGLLPRMGEWQKKDGPDRYFDSRILSNSVDSGQHASIEIFLLENDPAVYLEKPPLEPGIVRATLEKNNILKLVFSRPPGWSDCEENLPEVYVADRKKTVFCVAYGRKGKDQEGVGKKRILELKLESFSEEEFQALKRGRCKVRWRTGFQKEPVEVTVRAGSILDEPRFESRKKLGVFVRNNKTIARVFAPQAAALSLLLFEGTGMEPAGEHARDGGQCRIEEYPMKEDGHGVWETVIPENKNNRCYKIRVERNGKIVEGIDPYSRLNTAHDGYGVILEERLWPSVEKKGARRSETCQTSLDARNEGSFSAVSTPSFDISESVIYELHIRDFTVAPDSGIFHRGKYLGLAEAGTVCTDYPHIRTGLDHLIELGVNVIHIMPFQDFENNENSDEYNWGYMPVHFNCPDGWYATQTAGRARIDEVKRMIDALHEKGMKVVMDVVYNHTAENSENKLYSFRAMADTYYYRIKEDGSFWNGSGCGNEFRTESRMGRRFLIDSLLFWVREYGVDGFRFDLMGLIDIETLKKALEKLRKIKPDIIIYGEPWTAGETPIKPTLKGSQRGLGFAVFSDDFRDAIKGSVWDLKGGYVQNGSNRERVMTGIKGSIDTFAASPLETINYVSCHDNHTLWDRINLTEGLQATFEEKKMMNKLAAAIILTSQGIPFIHAGEEFLRSKNGEHNTYNLPDEINMIRWKLKEKNRDVFEFYRALIKMRREHPAFRMKRASDVKSYLKFYEELSMPVPDKAIAYVLEGEKAGDSWKKIIVLINPSRKEEEFILPEGLFRIVFNEQGSVLKHSGDAEVSGKCSVAPISLYVLVSSDSFKER